MQIPTDTLYAALAVAVQLGPISDDLNQRYCAGEPAAVLELQRRGRAILPGIRMQEAAELARWAAYGTPAELGSFLRTCYAERRVDTSAAAPAAEPPQLRQVAMF